MVQTGKQAKTGVPTADGTADGSEPEARPPPPPIDLSWMQRTLQWGTRAQPTKRGLTVDAINIGIYGHIPDSVQTRTRLPRGAYPAIGIPEIGGYHLRDAYQLWADNAGELYEEAISRRWSTATDLPWETAKGLPEDVEIAMCQVATELSHQANTEIEVVSTWLQQLNPIYHEVKLFLSTAVYDAARMFEGYRKRGMFNGGGMLIESPGWVNRLLLESMGGWTETALLLYLLRGSFTHTILRYLAAYGPTQLDRDLALRVMSDKARTTAYTQDHLRYSFSVRPEFARTYATALGAAEAAVARDERDPVLWEALAVVFGGGVRNIDRGMDLVTRLRRDWVNTYLDRLKTVGIERRAGVIEPLRSWITPAAEPATA